MTVMYDLPSQNESWLQNLRFKKFHIINTALELSFDTKIALMVPELSELYWFDVCKYDIVHFEKGGFKVFNHSHKVFP